MGSLNVENQERSHRIHWKSLSIGVILIVISLGTVSISRVYAPGEVYTFYVSSPRLQEYNIPGETLFLNITNAAIGSIYHVTFSVTDPSGTTKNSSNSTAAATSSIVLSVIYPRDFGPGTTIRLVGNYTVNVSQSQPSNKPNVQNGQFQVGLTDLKVYQRTSHISIKATGYASNESITTSLLQGTTPAIGFPARMFADASGNLNFSWHVPPSEPTGGYTLTLTGSTTTKTVTDSQTIIINVTNILIPGMTAKSSSIARSLTQQLILAPQYTNGQRVQTGQVSVRIAETDGLNVANQIASYDNLTGSFRCQYYVPKSAMAGIWIATIDPNSFNDGNNNTGPALTVTTGFNVQAAALNVSIISAAIGARTYTAGDIIPIYASVTFPDGSSLSTGNVEARLTKDGLPVGTPVSLTYITGQQAWAGTYQVGSSDPSGLWLITVDASDQMSDTGQGTYSATVDVPPTAPSTWLTTSNFLLITAIIAGTILALLFWALFASRRRVTHRQMKLDLRVVDKEVAKIEDSLFFRNIKKQVDDGSSAKDRQPDPPEKGEVRDSS